MTQHIDYHEVLMVENICLDGEPIILHGMPCAPAQRAGDMTAQGVAAHKKHTLVYIKSVMDSSV